MPLSNKLLQIKNPLNLDHNKFARHGSPHSPLSLVRLPVRHYNSRAALTVFLYFIQETSLCSQGLDAWLIDRLFNSYRNRPKCAAGDFEKGIHSQYGLKLTTCLVFACSFPWLIRHRHFRRTCTWTLKINRTGLKELWWTTKSRVLRLLISQCVYARAFERARFEPSFNWTPR